MTSIQAIVAASRTSRCLLKLQRQQWHLRSRNSPHFNATICRSCRAVSSSCQAGGEATTSPLSGPETFPSKQLLFSKESEGMTTRMLNSSKARRQQGQLNDVRLFSTTVEDHHESQISDSESTGDSIVGILEQESDPAMLFESLGMNEEDLYNVASQTPTTLKLGDMYKYANVPDKIQRLRNAQFLHRELPIRIAQRAVDLLTLPHGLSEAVPIRQVACAYISYLHRMQSMPRPETDEDENKFTDFLQSLVLDRSSIPMAIARGLAHWSSDIGEMEGERLQQMEKALYRFFTARVGLRFLTEHHVLSCNRESTKALRNVTCMFPEKDDFSGCIHSGLDLVVSQTTEFYGFSPEIEVVDCINRKENGGFTYVPHHLHYMMGELLKNSCRATIRNYLAQVEAAAPPVAMGALSRSVAPTIQLPPIKVVVVKGDEDVTIKVADKGGGIPRSRMTKIWKFAHSTADKQESASAFGTDALSGLKIRGFGLPLCRIYARYLGGDLTLKSMEGYGLDAYLFLPRLGEACENLPTQVQNSPGEKDSLPIFRARNGLKKGIRSFSSAPMPAVAPVTAEILLHELRNCTTEEARTKRIFDFLQSRA